jgi:murein L,D-transpeptidase YcbB/YkuD
MLLLRKTFRHGQIALFVLLFSLWGSTGLAAQGEPQGAYPYALVTPLLRNRIETYKSRPPGPPDTGGIYSLEALVGFYTGRNYEPAWFGSNGFADAESMVRAIKESWGDGFTPEYYHLGTIENLLGKAYAIQEKGTFVDPGILVDLDLLLTDSFFTLARHLSEGSVDPVSFSPEWSIAGNADVSKVLINALKGHRIGQTLRKLAPAAPEYAELRKALKRYREMAKSDDQQTVSDGRLLKKGTRSARVLELKKRLAFLGYLEEQSGTTTDFFDVKLEQAVTHSQERHGLKADGIVGPSTLQELNTPVEERVRQIMVNMERLRWSNAGRGDRYLIVNIARFELDAVEKGNVVLSMKVVVGKPFQDTPVFRGKMTYLVLNPVWNVPDSIAKKEMLPEIRKNRAYLGKENITVLRGWGDSEQEIDPDTIRWKSITERNLYFRFRQEPGPLNPLGRIKFMFPNRFNVYLHDTPARYLFEQNVRAFSHGCIRIEHPLELAEYVLQGDPRWTKESITAAIEEGSTQEVRLPQPLDVYIVYVTAWVDKDGSVQFRDDLYGRDADLYEALTQNPAQPRLAVRNPPSGE